MAVNIDNRVSDLEKVLLMHMEHTNNALAALSREMQDFKVEMQDFKDEMRDFKDEMQDFKDEMQDFKNEMREDRREMNRQWGNLANKMGTMVEDIIIPGIRPALKTYFNANLEFLASHMHKKIRKSGEEGEFDIVAVDKERVYIVEVKISPDKMMIRSFLERTIPKFRKLFPEYKDHKVIPIVGSLRFSEDLIRYASESGVYLLGYREWDYLDILNFDQVVS